jgi:uncharacterized DUF497 family protein
MNFEWDQKKNKVNYHNHGVRFEEAQTIWADPGSLEFFDPEHSGVEDRFLRIGFSTNNRLLLVVFCERNSFECLRIISARKATLNERRSYEEGI